MPDGGDMLAAIASARALRQKRQALRCKAVIILLAMAAVGVCVAAGILHAPQPSAAAESRESLSIEDAIMEAIDPYDDFPEIDWDYWHSVNPDVIGWVTIDGTSIDHPIVMASKEAPSFYLSHAIDGSADGKGCIFLDAECETGLESSHSVVYGHNWKGGLMFADLAKYADGDFASEHPRILLQTPTWKRRLDVQCVEIANGTDESNVLAFSDARDLAHWYEERFHASIIKLTEIPSSEKEIDPVFTFCTCAPGGTDKRVLVYAIPEMIARAESRATASTV